MMASRRLVVSSCAGIFFLPKKQATTTSTTLAMTIKMRSSSVATAAAAATTRIITHQQRRSFVDSKKEESKNNNKKQQRRRKKSLSQPAHKSITTRDRLRLFSETNLVQKSPTYYQDFFELAKSRADFFTTKLYTYWNPDYGKEGEAIAKNNQPIVPGESLTPRPYNFRTFKNETLVMDERWWIWNILFHMAPAILLILYCELYGNYAMKQFYIQQEREQMLNIMGEEWCAKHADVILDNLIQEKLTFPEKLAKFKDDVIVLVQFYLSDEGSSSSGEVKSVDVEQQQETTTSDAVQPDDSKPTIPPRTLPQESHTQPPHHQQGIDSSTTRATTRESATLIDADTTIMTQQHPSAETASTSTVTANNNNSSNTTNTTDSAVVKELLKRVQELEAKLTTTEQPTIIKDDNDDEEKIISQQFKEQMEKAQQSGVQNRYEKDMIDKWQRQWEEIQRKRAGDDESRSSESSSTSSTGSELSGEESSWTGSLFHFAKDSVQEASGAVGRWILTDKNKTPTDEKDDGPHPPYSAAVADDRPRTTTTKREEAHQSNSLVMEGRSTLVNIQPPTAIDNQSNQKGTRSGGMMEGETAAASIRTRSSNASTSSNIEESSSSSPSPSDVPAPSKPWWKKVWDSASR